ncbi:uncharacterized protein LOC131626444 [Vicia villosa]|uniref:uncharacterized protein LOC131626444 n=1 Tax=Vicia villosa TaxID=3911 RepID=UPI00273BD16E|nr:uncharacterized protein LOC131626444 [Vicia villosa]
MHVPSEEQRLKLCINHKGTFVSFPVKCYVESLVYEMDFNVDVDFVNYKDIESLVFNVGYTKFSGIPDVVEFCDEGPLDGDVINEVPLDEDVNDDVPLDGDVNNEVHLDDDDVSNVEKEGTNGANYDEGNNKEDVNMEGTNGVRNDEEVYKNFGANSDSEEDWDYVPTEVGSESETHFDIPVEGEEWDWTHEFESDDEFFHKRKFPTFKVYDNGDPVRFELDMQFVSKELIKDAVKDHDMETRTNLWLKKNDAIRVVVKCQLNCPFHMLVAKRSGSQYWLVTSLKPNHECVRSVGNKQAKTKWLAKKFIPLIRHTPHIKPSGLADEAFLRWNVKLNHFQAYRANKRAMGFIEAQPFSSIWKGISTLTSIVLNKTHLVSFAKEY